MGISVKCIKCNECTDVYIDEVINHLPHNHFDVLKYILFLHLRDENSNRSYGAISKIAEQSELIHDLQGGKVYKHGTRAYHMLTEAEFHRFIYERVLEDIEEVDTEILMRFVDVAEEQKEALQAIIDKAKPELEANQLLDLIEGKQKEFVAWVTNNYEFSLCEQWTAFDITLTSYGYYIITV